MEEPEIALPPHTQRRVTRFVLSQMGQAIVTSHSPYVIEQFQPEQIVVLNRADQGKLSGVPIDLQGIKPKVFARERRQFAEAILANAVLVVEGATEAAIFPAASSVLEQDLGPGAYSHFDIAGVTVFDAGGDGSTPQYGPCFAALGKRAFCFCDKPNSPVSEEAAAKFGRYTQVWESPEKGIETLLVKEVPEPVLRRFLNAVKDRSDFPQVGTVAANLTEAEVRGLTQKVLEARKGINYRYGSLLIAQCNGSGELPPTIRDILLAIHESLTSPTAPRLAEGTLTAEPTKAEEGSGAAM
jgi:putative ATP-dependent endonuclease of OLD family